MRINWKDWWQGQRFREGDTIRIQAGNGDPPFSFRQHLGSGSFATVLEVQVLGTTSVCALKIYKSRPTSAFDPFREKFENEIHNMREVSNRHIASFFGAYICERENKPVRIAELTKATSTAAGPCVDDGCDPPQVMYNEYLLMLCVPRFSLNSEYSCSQSLMAVRWNS